VITTFGFGVTNPNEAWDLCSDTLHPTLNWEVSGGTPTGYDVEIYSDSGLENLIYEYEVNTGNSTSHYANFGADGDNYLDTNGTCASVGENGFHNSSRCNLNYGSTYWWRVRVEDGDDVSGNWSETGSFTVASNHHYPESSFSTDPESLQTGSITDLLDGTTSYGVSTVASWTWEISGSEDTDYTYMNSTTDASQNPDVQFNTTGGKTISLQTTDSDCYGPCSCSEGVDVSGGQIQWYETSPTH
jgi:hypothetical protein